MALALAAGVLAAVNPCGFALLPAYVSLLVVSEEQGRIRRALALTAAMTLGFVTVFGLFGLIAAPSADWIGQRLPWLTVAIGLVLAGLGGWMLTGRGIPSPVPKLRQAPELTRRFGSMYLFGISFALASLGCTIGPFLVVVASSFSSPQGIWLFLAYAAGMALVVGTVAVAVALAQQSVLRWLRRWAGATQRVAGALMVLAGAYVAWYGWFGIRQNTDPAASDPVIDAFGTAQTWLSAWLDGLGVTTIALALLALTAAGALARWWRSRR